MAEYAESSWKQLKSELNVRFVDVNDNHNVFTMLCKASQKWVPMGLSREAVWFGKWCICESR